MTAATDRVAVLGVRHHGPGSARSVLAELDRLKPAVVLVEGPADAGDMLALAADPDLVPPVALLAYAPDAPRECAFWPYAVFSPEWQALAWAAAHQVPARFCDLPAATMLACDREALAGPDGDPAALHGDPIERLAAAAGFDDPERWWDTVIESRLDGGSPFAALTDAIAELRAAPPGSRAASRSRSSAARRRCARSCAPR